jgi:hypothetical protein
MHPRTALVSLAVAAETAVSGNSGARFAPAWVVLIVSGLLMVRQLVSPVGLFPK